MNLLANVGTFGVNVLTSLFFTPFLVRKLGPAGYSLAPLAIQIGDYFKLVLTGINGAIGRYLTVAMERGDEREANRVFSTAVIATAAAVGVLAIPLTAVIVFLPNLVDLPLGAELDARIVFVAAFACLMTSGVLTPIDTVAFAKNRFDLRSLAQASAIVSRVGTLVFFLTLVSARPMWVGVALGVQTVVQAGIQLYVWRILAPELVISRASYSTETLRGMIGVAGWSLVKGIGEMFFLATHGILTNRLFGAEASGFYLLAYTWGVMLASLADALVGVFGPTQYAYYARGDIDGLVTFSRRAVKLNGLFLALPFGAVAGLALPILRTWGGQALTHLAPLMAVLSSGLLVTYLNTSLENIHLATKKNRLPALVSAALGLTYVVLAIVLAKTTDLGLYSIAIANIAMFGLRESIFVPIYTARILDRPWYTFSREQLPVTVVGLGVAACFWWLSHRVDLSGWGTLALCGLVATPIYATVVWVLILDKDDRALIDTHLLARFRRRAG